MKQRIITAIVFGAIFIPVTIYGGLPITILAYLFASVALYEVLKMRKINILSVPGLISLLLLWVIMVPQQLRDILEGIRYSKIEFVLLAVLLFLTYTVASKNRFTFDDVAFSILATLYVGIGFYFFIETREAGLVYIFYSLFIIWATDSGAYFIGRAMGKNKLWPEISPNKTIEGSVGGVICALIVAALFVLFSNIEATFLQLSIITIVLSVFGQIGDLVESALKRHYDVKDSGNLLPGHGGILDRFDSLLFVWPLLHYIYLL
ncbi:phosphatidate cytidylyltransferase [Bacillus sp. S/N-304-OC-R1]|uniref:phosphatidate cytidylyltransferase n=1 Tax=Bacillus sp. S/N-304-OC-R1 TaxID=2758034 RepID=UPI001C8D23EA|nr:phosphatidate cytidylyltransferase [Bacillus sp. S/N-304-OC-R1]MBY0120661.1 phosphatidate cytidylyltransferase [Bacillus sp. S/N-304-OC-R1]